MLLSSGIHVYVNTYTHKPVPEHKYRHIHAFIHTYTHAHIHTQMHAYTHTYTHNPRKYINKQTFKKSRFRLKI